MSISDGFNLWIGKFLADLVIGGIVLLMFGAFVGVSIFLSERIAKKKRKVKP